METGDELRRLREALEPRPESVERVVRGALADPRPARPRRLVPAVAGLAALLALAVLAGILAPRPASGGLHRERRRGADRAAWGRRGALAYPQWRPPRGLSAVRVHHRDSRRNAMSKGIWTLGTGAGAAAARSRGGPGGTGRRGEPPGRADRHGAEERQAGRHVPHLRQVVQRGGGGGSGRHRPDYGGAPQRQRAHPARRDLREHRLPLDPGARQPAEAAGDGGAAAAARRKAAASLRISRSRSICG